MASDPRSAAAPERPLGGYLLLIATFGGAAASFATWMRRSGRELPERVSAGDLALITLATHKASRLVSKDRVTSVVRAPFTSYTGEGGPGEVEEEPRGRGVRRAVGELISCPYCIGMWIAAALVGALAVAPRTTRWVAAVLAVLFGSDVLQIVYRKLEDLLR